MAGLEQKEYQEGITPIDFGKLKDTSSRVNEFDRQLKKLPDALDTDGNKVDNQLSGLEFKNTFPSKLDYTVDNITDRKGNIKEQKVKVLYDDHEMGYLTRKLKDKNNEQFVDEFMSFHTQLFSTYGALKLDNPDHEKLIYASISAIVSEQDIQEYHRRNALNTPEPKDLKDTKKGIDQDTKELKKTNKEYLKLNTSNVNHIGQLLAEKISRKEDLHATFLKKSFDLFNAQLDTIEKKLLEPGLTRAIKDDLERQAAVIELGLQKDAAKYLILVAQNNPDPDDQKIAENLCKLLPALYNYDFEPSRIKGFFKDLATMKSGGKLVIKNGFTEDGTPERVIEEYFNIIFAEKHLYGQGAPGVVEGDRGWFRKNKLIADGRGKGSGQVLTPGATGATRNVYRGDVKVETTPDGLAAQSYIKTHIRYKTINKTSQAHEVTDIDLNRAPFSALIDLYHNYKQEMGTEYSKQDFMMIQYHLLKQISTGIAQQSAIDVFTTLGNGDKEAGKVIFHDCLKGSLFNKDFPLSGGLIQKINAKAHKDSAGLRGTGADVYSTGGTALDEVGGYDRAVNPGVPGSGSMDEVIRRSAAHVIASHFQTGDVAVEVVLNPRQGVYYDDKEVADVFRNIAAANGMPYDLGTDRSAKDLLYTGLKGGTDALSAYMQSKGFEKGFSDGTGNAIQIVANIAETGFTIASLFRGAKAGLSVLKGGRNAVFGDGTTYEAHFKTAWGHTKSAIGYGAASMGIGILKDPTGYVSKNPVIQTMINVFGTDEMKQAQLQRKIQEDGILRWEANNMKTVLTEVFAGFSASQLISAGILNKGTKGIYIDPDKLIQLDTSGNLARKLQQMSPPEQATFLRNLAKEFEANLVYSYGLDLETFDAIKDDTGDFINTLSARHLRKGKLEESLKDMGHIPGLNINKEELLKLDDAALEERIARFEAIKTLYTKLSPAGYDTWGDSFGEDFVAKFSYAQFNSKILGAEDRPSQAMGSTPRSFQQYRQDKLIELADAPDKVTADTIFASMMNVLANVSASQDLPPPVTSNAPAAAGTTVVPSTTADEPNYRDSSGTAPSMYEYMTEKITALTIPQKDVCKTGKKEYFDLIKLAPPNFEWKELEN